MSPSKTTAVVLLSGGQDSTTCLWWAKRHFDNVVAIGFDYGQSHEIELEQASMLADLADVEYHVIEAGGLLATSSLTDGTVSHDEPSYLDETLPASFTPGRNLLFLTVAAAQAVKYGARHLVTGVCQTDYSGYPDCRRTTIDALQLALSLGMGGGDFQIHTPLMYLTKAETWKMAADMGPEVFEMIRSMTMTDYNGDTTMNEWGMGSIDNPASKLRAAGYFEARTKGWI